MSPIAAKVTAIEKRGDQYQVVVQISPKYRGSYTLAFGERKPHSGSLQHGRLDLLYYQNPGLSIGDPFRFGLFIDGRAEEEGTWSNSHAISNRF